MSFNVSLSGMAAAQSGIKVTQQNISNMNTEGYARQRMELTEIGTSSGSGINGKVGSGVKIEDIKMVTDKILQNNYNNQNSKVNYFGELEGTLHEVETVMGDFTTGKLGNMMQGFFQSWEELSKFPEESAYYFSMVGETTKLTQKINEMGSELSRIEQDTIMDTTSQVGQVNAIISNLASINQKMNNSGQHIPNSLLNERDREIEKLSQYLDIEVSHENDNPEIVTLRSGGVFLVSNEDKFPLKLVKTEDGSFISNGTSRLEPTWGKIKASTEATNGYLQKYRDDLDTFTEQLMSQVNAIHSAGFSRDGDTGIDFFVGAGSKTIQINPLLQADVSKVATSSVNGVEGNSEVAKQMAKAIEGEVVNGMNFRNFVNGYSMGMAQDLNTTRAQISIQSQVLEGVLEQKESVQGVNLEEEMSNLMMYQKMFSANAKTINVLKEIDDAILQLV